MTVPEADTVAEAASAPVADRSYTARRLWVSLCVLAGCGLFLGLTGLFEGGEGTLWANPLTRFLLTVAVILFVSHCLGGLMNRIGQPPVLGEILGGLALGPSALGLLWPEASAQLFPPGVLDNLDKVAQLGLIIFMFLIGCEVRTGRLRNQGPLGATLVGGTALPFVCGAAFALFFAPMLIGEKATTTQYALFVGLALAITAVPVLARILVDLTMDRTPVGSLAMTCAAMGDGLAWLALTVVLTGSEDPGQLLRTGGWVCALGVLTFLGVRPLLVLLVPRLSMRALTIVLVIGAVCYAILTQVMHLHPVIGAFLFGTVVPRNEPVIDRITTQLRSFTLLILLPLFFAGIGLQTSVGVFGSDPAIWGVFALMLVVAQLAKLLGAGGAARLAGLPARESLQLGILMNCRGVTELIVAKIGYEADLINTACFTMLVLLAVLTTALTGIVMPRLGSPAGGPDGGTDGKPAGTAEPDDRTTEPARTASGEEPAARPVPNASRQSAQR
ncbi:cation:proton antiporter [Streptomyces lunaelactis]|uniref:cation:proton antiporter n=1 Tax=Streptomyces lunaelactis TaxID=1535768 RepID=UPI001584F88B|nr:cation:proton antiporter [Streptomyces lunaelactis]NUK03895.1 cation:proton antiporter [Streptomyces lunaelactis]NUK18919.1 cation:proton antiporter [Streptomyces lunaelactis]